MSATGECFILQTDDLDALRTVADRDSRSGAAPSSDSYAFLSERSVARLSYAWSGYVLATLLPWLDERGIALMDSEHEELADLLNDATGGTFFVFTTDHRRRFLDLLRGLSFDPTELRTYYEAFNETQAEGVEEPLLDGIRLLSDTLGRIDDDKAAILAIV